MIKFVWEKRPEPEDPELKDPTFGDVEDGAFFVSSGGYLCQKVDKKTVNIIARNTGRPHANTNKGMGSKQRILRIIGKPEKIEF